MAAELFDDFRRIVLEGRPLIDVRAPVEFEKGAFPNAVNLPLMDDEERRLVGICYKQKGNEAAVKLGHELVSGEKKAQRVKAWCDFKRKHPDALLYCFRGGQRSQISQRWMEEAGCDIPRLKGGYKAFRRFLIEETERSYERFSPIVLAGRTGCGKTLLLEKLPHAVDLEGLANHRGSSFGRKITPQPSQIDFENALAYDLIRKVEKGYGHLVFEDEGKNVGRLYLPLSLYRYLENAPLAVLETPMPKRVAITFEEYVLKGQEAYAKMGFDDPLARWSEDMHAALDRIRKRLGGERHKEASALLREATLAQRNRGDMAKHELWIEYLLKHYYDPMYDYQIARRKERIVFRGEKEAMEAWLRERSRCTTSP
ncbi:tRNA 2-selenouridine(34) synthase MnmH [Hydrogenimonas sp. SS33]|uniref:tRNA 2-selenouridine(34) synthase MnmH n=1 Tax=Hydrogenimonas leucolamina TaxID=2954236 RepID=UPI00336BF098